MRHSFLTWKLIWQLSIFGVLLAIGGITLVSASQNRPWHRWKLLAEESQSEELSTNTADQAAQRAIATPLFLPNGRPRLSPLPTAKEVWQCEVVVVGGSLGGVAAASHAMKSGARTCLIELTPWLGGQISSQGVSALDESIRMRQKENFSASWNAFKSLIARQPIKLPSWVNPKNVRLVADINSCWVSSLCFPPKAGAQAALQLLQYSAKFAPGSRWGTAIAFKGATFDQTGDKITAIYAVKRIPRQHNYMPLGRPSKELSSWYSWSDNETFTKIPLRLEAPPGKRLIVIDATDTGELIAWARIPHRVGSESRKLTGEPNGSIRDNPECTQAFTFPFVLAIKKDQGKKRVVLAKVKPEYSRQELRQRFSLQGFSMFEGRSLFKYRRIVSTTRNSDGLGVPAPRDMTMVNWMQGNDWNLMNPPLILTDKKLLTTGQYSNWMGGLSLSALRQAEENALIFSEWLIKSQSKAQFPLTHLWGIDSPMGTVSGLSMMPYIREGRRILGRSAYRQKIFMIQENDVKKTLWGGRNFQPTAVAVTHYDIDIHGCLYRNWQKSGEAEGAGIKHFYVRPTFIPLESLVPQGVDNLLVGGKTLAVTHIVNGLTRIHYSEWSIGGAAGATAGWLVKQNQPDLMPATIVPKRLMPQLQKHLVKLGLRFDW